MVVTKLRLELPNIAEVAVYPATQYVQTTTYIVLYGGASLQYGGKIHEEEIYNMSIIRAVYKGRIFSKFVHHKSTEETWNIL